VTQQYEGIEKAIHQDIFQKKILSDYDLESRTSQANPKAIILAGQPGAGKGGLVSAARNELLKDVVVIDPDALREYHPNIKQLQSEHPYTWSGDTHADASQWAQELRTAAIDGKKNIIIDTTLGSGKNAVEMIKDLQARGYEVEVRAIATHRLESELGVDERFTRDIDKKGFGRYVPEEVRTKVCEALPGNLDLVQKETGIPVRIFNREGAELYDSRISTLQPGAALEEAREARLKDPNITRGLRDGWKEQQTWHGELSESLPQNRKLEPSTAQNVLTQRTELKVVEGIERGAIEALEIDHVTRVRPTQIKAGTALGIAGLALDAYDAADTYQKVSQLQADGNQVGAHSELVHFGTRNLGALGGAALGATAGAAAGIESGPGLFLTGAIGGIAGAVASDKLAAYLDNRKIYNQEDHQGNTWHFDPETPKLGWRREDEVAMVNNKTGAMQESERSFVASPQLADELNYKASTTSVQLILRSPPTPSDPYTLAADKNDVHSITPADWKREPSSGTWQREVVEQIVDRGLKITRPESAIVEKAAELDRASEAIIAQNAAMAPAAIAARYEATHAQSGWLAYGPVPDAVTNARNNLDRQPASDRNTYERGQNGEWTSSGVIYDSQAHGNIQKELNATRQQLQEGLPPAPISQAPPVQSHRDNLRETVAATYANAGVSTTPQLLEAATLAVERDHTRGGITTAYAMTLQLDPNNRYSADSPIATLQKNDHGVNAVKTVTTVKEILEIMQTSPSSPSPSLPKPGSDKDDAPGTNTPNKSAQLGHPSSSDHPFHSVFNQVAAHVNKEDEKQGRKPDEKSDRLIMSATALAVDNGMHKIDHMVFSKENPARGIKVGENVIVVQGGLLDPAHERADMKTAVAINTPVEQSLKQMDVTHQRQTQEAQSLAQLQSQSPRGPTMT
jgi:predicted ABC-type ATPase